MVDDQSLTETVSYLGFRETISETTKTVLHMGTVPYPDFIWIRGPEGKTFRKDHSLYEWIGCSNKGCIVGRDHYEVRSNCPCLDNGPTDEVCFLSAVPGLFSDLKEGQAPLFKGEEIALCFDHKSIFDSEYSAGVRTLSGTTGWGHVENIDQVLALLGRTYWFNYRSNGKKLANFTRKHLMGKNIRELRAIVFNTLVQMRNLFIKRIMVFPDIPITYEEVYDLYQHQYKEFLPCYSENEDGDISNCKVYEELRNAFNFFKENFHSEDYELRTEVLDHEFQSEALFLTFTIPIRMYQAKIVERFYENGHDETLSPSWMERWGMMCQTRMLGKFPKPLAKLKVKEYLEKIQIRTEKPLAELKNAKVLIDQWLDDTPLRRNFLQPQEFETEEIQKLREECWSSLTLRVKFTASTDFTRKVGGKAEEARRIIGKARSNKWEVPVRDLDTGKITMYLKLPDDPEGPIHEYLFWLAFQLTINSLWVHRGIQAVESFYYPMVDKGIEFVPDAFRTRVEAINEPGKVRMLVKTTGVLYWFLTPMGEILNNALTFVKEHEQGLKGSSQGWRFQKEISGRGSQSSMIYDMDWNKRENLYFGFSDMTEATDFIPRNLGIVLIRSLMDYIGIGRFWAGLTCLVLNVDLPVEKVVLSHIPNKDDEDKPQEIVWKGNIMGGFMMGMPCTKTVLHLSHALAEAKTRFYMGKTHRVKKKEFGPMIKPISNIAKEMRPAITTL